MKIRLISMTVLACLVLATTPIALAADYDVELVVPSGKKTKETDSVLSFGDSEMSVTPDKQKFKNDAKTFAFEDIESAEYSYAKKPMLSGGGAIATALVAGLFVLPFLFMKKKKHWITVQTETEFAVIKMKKSNYRSILAEFKTNGVEVVEIKEEKKDK
ncbi:MAG: hypothetical protein HKN33_07675 [Pyrinomonadaceae bacterium]|nr:hypothetical protein [Pyrinomonadaceae bacterium]